MPLAAKKSTPSNKGFGTYFCDVDHPPYVILKEETQILTAHQKEGLDGTKKVQLGTRGFCTHFCAVDHPLICDFERKNKQILLLIKK